MIILYFLLLATWCGVTFVGCSWLYKNWAVFLMDVFSDIYEALYA